MISFYEGAIFSKASYDREGKFPLPWERIDFYENEHSGLSISVFHHHEEQKTVIAFRGTKNIQNIVSDAQLLLQWPLDIAEEAKIFYEERKATYYQRIIFTGHSLGAALASSMSLDYGISAIIFDSPGFYQHAVRKPYFSRHEELIHSIMGQPNLINTCHQQVGTLLFADISTYHRLVGTGVDVIRDSKLLHGFIGTDYHEHLKTATDSVDIALSLHSTFYLHKLQNFLSYLEDSSKPVFRIKKWVNWIEHTNDPQKIPMIIRRYELHDKVITICNDSIRQQTSFLTLFKGENIMLPSNNTKPADDRTNDLLTLEEPLHSEDSLVTPLDQGQMSEGKISADSPTIQTIITQNALLSIETQKLSNALCYLGCSVMANGRKGERAFDVDKNDIEIGVTDTWYKLENCHDLTEYDKNFKIKFALNIENIVEAGFQRGASTATENRKSGVVLTIIHHQPVELKKRFPNLTPSHNVVGLPNLGVTYIHSGALVFGFQLIIEGISSGVQEVNSDYDANVKVDACVKAIKVGLKGGVSSVKKSNTATKKLRITIKGVGGYVAPMEVLSSIQPTELEERLNEVYQDFLSKASQMPGKFFYNGDSLQKTEQQICLSIQTPDTSVCLTKNGNSLHWDTELEEYFSVSSIGTLAPTQSIWDHPFSIYKTNEDGDKCYLQIIGNDGELCLMQEGGEEDYDVTLQWRPTVWSFGKSVSASKETHRFLIGEDHSKQSWTLKKTRNHLVELCPKTDTTSRQLIDFQVIDPDTKTKFITSIPALDSARPDHSISSDLHELQHTMIDQITPKQQRAVVDFLTRVFPKLKNAQGQSLVLMLGNTGAGKSTYINALLGHNFSKGETIDTLDFYDHELRRHVQRKKTFFEVVDSHRPYAEMGDSPESVTTEPAVFFVDPRYTGEHAALCDLPGFLDTKKEDASIAFSMFMVKEMAEEIKSAVIMINYAELDASRGAVFKNLINTLEVIFHSDQMYSIAENIIFIVNLKGIDITTKLSPEQTIEQHVMNEIRKLIDYYNRFLAANQKVKEFIQQASINDPELAEGLREVDRQPDAVAGKSGWWRRLPSQLWEKLKGIGRLLGLDDSASQEDVQKLLLEVEEKEGAIKILRMITTKSLIIWNSVDDLECRRNFWKRLNTINRPIHKSFLHFELANSSIQNYWRCFDNYVYYSYLKPLSKLKEIIDEHTTKIKNNEEKILFLRADESNRAKRLKEDKKNISRKSTELKKKKDALTKYKLEEHIIETVSMPEAKSGWWSYAKSEKTFTAEEGTFYTHVTIHRTPWMVVDDEPTISKSLLIYDSSQILKFRQKEFHEIKTYSTIKFTAEKESFWSSIKSGDVSIELKTIRAYCAAYANVIAKKDSEIITLEGEINRLKTRVETDKAVKNIDEQIKRLNKIIEQSRETIQQVQDRLRKNRSVYEKGYSDWQPIYAILKRALDAPEASQCITYPNIELFLELAEELYQFSPKNENANDQLRHSQNLTRFQQMLDRWDPQSSEKELQAVLIESKKDFARTEGVQFSQQVMKYGLNLMDVPSDGNCFFHALLHQLQTRYFEVLERLALKMKLNKRIEHHDLRQFAVESLIRAVEYGHLSEAIVGKIDGYISDMTQDRSWADGIVIPILAKALNITIVLINSDGNLPTVIHREGDGTIYLGYQVGIHFQSTEGEANEQMSQDMMARSHYVDNNEVLSTNSRAMLKTHLQTLFNHNYRFVAEKTGDEQNQILKFITQDNDDFLLEATQEELSRLYPDAQPRYERNGANRHAIFSGNQAMINRIGIELQSMVDADREEKNCKIS